MTLSRADRSGFTTWWWTIDRVSLFITLALIAIGLVLAFAASPAATGGGLNAGDFRFAGRQTLFAVAGLVDPRLLFAAVVARGEADGRHRLRLRTDRCGAGDLHRQRGSGCQALDRSRLDDDPAIRIPQARPGRARCGHSRRQGEDDSAQAAHYLHSGCARRRGAAAPARCRADGAAARAMGRAALLLWHFGVVDRRAVGWCVQCSASCPMSCSRMCSTAFCNSSATTSPAIRRACRSRRLPMAASGASAPARARSNTSSPMRIPISSSPWRARSSASSCAG